MFLCLEQKLFGFTVPTVFGIKVCAEVFVSQSACLLKLLLVGRVIQREVVVSCDDNLDRGFDLSYEFNRLLVLFQLGIMGKVAAVNHCVNSLERLAVWWKVKTMSIRQDKYSCHDKRHARCGN